MLRLFLSAAMLAVIGFSFSTSAGNGATAQCGRSSWYGPGFHGRVAASGERFNQNAMTAAHKTLPFGTKIKVTNQSTGRSITVRINDRGPYHGGRILDLSKAAALELGIVRAGTGKVCIART